MLTTDITIELATLRECCAVLAVKFYRVHADLGNDPVPVLPCLDHEAMLHQRVAPHLSAYVLEPTLSEIHEVGLYPASRVVVIDTVSTLGESSIASHARLSEALRRRFPDYRLSIKRPSWWRDDRRVAEACRAQISLREVLLGEPTDHLKRQTERLQMVGALMEKQSRVASWGVRTSTAPILAAAGAAVYAVLGLVAPRVGFTRVEELQYALIGAISAAFLYFGLKAVQLTDMANRVWKRSSEYSLILGERRRLAGQLHSPMPKEGSTGNDRAN